MSHSNPTVQYHTLLEDILDNGVRCENRTGIDTHSVFGRVMRFNISEGKVPLIHSKKVFTKGIFHELIWMLSGNTNIRYLKKHGVSIWDSWVKPGTEEYVDQELVAGELPKIYQHQWRRWMDTRVVPHTQHSEYEQVGFEVIGSFEGLEGDEEAMCVVRREIDQIQNLVDKLRTNPDDRRIILSAWNVAEIEEMALPPCHTLLHLKPYKMGLTEREMIAEERNIPLEEVATYSLSGLLYQRSVDTSIGCPFNIVQYSLLIQMLAHVAHMETDEFVWVGGDCHVYENQIEVANQQLGRPTEGPYTPRIRLNPEVKDIFDFTYDDIELLDYHPQPALKYPPAAV